MGLAALKTGYYSFSSPIALGTRQPGTGVNETQATVQGGGGQAWPLVWFPGRGGQQGGCMVSNIPRKREHERHLRGQNLG